MGRKFRLSGFSTWKDLDLDFEIVGVFPAGRYDTLAAINRDYYNAALDAYPQAHAGREHPMADRSLSLVLVKVDDKQAYNRVAEQITTSPYYHNPQVKCETESSGVGSFLDAYRDLLWGMRWLLVAGLPGDPGPGLGQRHQHQRPRAADGNSGAQGARFPARLRSSCW